MKIKERAVSPLLEMLISIMILAFAGVVSLNIFLSARNTQRLSDDKTEAMYMVQNVIETMKISPLSEIKEENILWYDENWQQTTEEKAMFSISSGTEENEGFLSGTVVCTRTEPYSFLPEGTEKLCSVEFGRAAR